MRQNVVYARLEISRWVSIIMLFLLISLSIFQGSMWTGYFRISCIVEWGIPESAAPVLLDAFNGVEVAIDRFTRLFRNWGASLEQFCFSQFLDCRNFDPFQDSEASKRGFSVSGLKVPPKRCQGLLSDVPGCKLTFFWTGKVDTCKRLFWFKI